MGKPLACSGSAGPISVLVLPCQNLPREVNSMTLKMMGIHMVENAVGLTPGTVTQRHLDLLIEGTSIRGEKITNTLRDYFVNGLTAADAWKKNGLNSGQFYKRLKVIQAESNRANELSVYYAKLSSKTSNTAQTKLQTEAAPAPEPLPKDAPAKGSSKKSAK